MFGGGVGIGVLGGLGVGDFGCVLVLFFIWGRRGAIMDEEVREMLARLKFFEEE